MRFIFYIVPKSLFIHEHEILKYETFAEDEYWAMMNFWKEHPEWIIL